MWFLKFVCLRAAVECLKFPKPSCLSFFSGSLMACCVCHPLSLAQMLVGLWWLPHNVYRQCSSLFLLTVQVMQSRDGHFMSFFQIFSRKVWMGVHNNLQVKSGLLPLVQWCGFGHRTSIWSRWRSLLYWEGSTKMSKNATKVSYHFENGLFLNGHLLDG